MVGKTWWQIIVQHLSPSSSSELTMLKDGKASDNNMTPSRFSYGGSLSCFDVWWKVRARDIVLNVLSYFSCFTRLIKALWASPWLRDLLMRMVSMNRSSSSSSKVNAVGKGDTSPDVLDQSIGLFPLGLSLCRVQTPRGRTIGDCRSQHI